MRKSIVVLSLVALMLLVGVFGAVDLEFVDADTGVTGSPVTPGSSFTYTFNVESTDTDPATQFTVDFTSMTRVGEPSVVLFNAGSAYVHSGTPLATGQTIGQQTRTVGIPALQKAGAYHADLQIKNGTTVYDTTPLDIVVSEVPAATVTALSASLVQGKTGVLTITVQNTGNKDLNLNPSAITFSGPGGASLTYSVTPVGVLNVPYQSTRTMNLTFNVPANQQLGDYTASVTFTDGTFSVGTNLQANVRAPVRSVSISSTNFSTVARETTQSRTLTVTNTGDFTLNNVVFGTTLDSRFNPTLSTTGVASLASGASTTVTLTFAVPLEEDSGLKTFGNFVVTADGGFVANAPVVGEVESRLKIDEVEVQLEGEKKKTVSEGSDVNDVKPFMEVKLTAKVENTFTTDNDIDVGELTFTIVGIDDGDDIELDAETFEVKDGDDKEETVSFEVPETVNHDEEFDVEVFIEGEDENGATHTDTFTFRLKIEKEKHEFRLVSEISPTTLTTCTDTFNIDFTLSNLGQEDEEDVVFKMTSEELDINELEEVGDLSSDYDDDEYSFQKFFTFDMPSSIDAGSYTIKQDVYVEEDKLEEHVEFDVEITECNSGSDSESEDNDNDNVPLPPFSSEDEEDEQSGNDDVEVVTAPPATETPVTGSDDVVTATPVDSTDGEGFTSSPWYVVLLVVGNLAIIAILLALIAKVLKKN